MAPPKPLVLCLLCVHVCTYMRTTPSKDLSYKLFKLHCGEGEALSYPFNVTDDVPMYMVRRGKFAKGLAACDTMLRDDASKNILGIMDKCTDAAHAPSLAVVLASPHNVPSEVPSRKKRPQRGSQLRTWKTSLVLRYRRR